MKFTLYWLKQFIELKEDGLEAVTNALNSLGMEVESVAHSKASLDDFLVGAVVECNPHIKGEGHSLNICKVDIGQERLLNVVCGAPNVRVGLKIVFAKIGSVIPSSGMVIALRKIKNMESEGMICSSAELCIGEDDGTIIELDSKCEIGSKFIDACPWACDPVIEIAVTPNRPDWLGVYGIARDLSAYGLGNMRKLNAEGIATQSCGIKVFVEDGKACPLFLGKMITGVDNSRPTSAWLKTLLYRIGHSSISPIVDITNYINYSFNRPMHAYDADFIKGNQLFVRFAGEDETMQPIGSSEKEAIRLYKNDLVVADREKVCALAGVIGDDRSKCSDKTENIFLEAAIFIPELVYKTGRRHGINTDSKYRFERGVDLNFTETGMNIAVAMMLKECQGIASDLIVIGSTKAEPRFINFDPNKILKLSGLNLPVTKVIHTLEVLGFVCEDQGDFLRVEIPAWRNDVSIQEDLVEEVIRVIGYDSIPLLAPKELSSEPVPITKARVLAKCISTLLAASGYDEMITWSFMSSKVAGAFGFLKHSMVITNPLSIEMDVLRYSLLPNLLGCIARNNVRSFKNISLFEVGDMFSKDGSQSRMICGVRSGNTTEENIYQNSREFDFFDLKADVINSLTLACNIDEQKLDFICHKSEDIPEYYHPGKASLVLVEGVSVGYLGAIHPRILKFMDIGHATAAFEIFIDKLKYKKQYKKFLPSDYQPVTRDFAFVIDNSVTAQVLLNAVRTSDKLSLIKKISLFDVFHSEELGPNKKSLAIKVLLQAQDRTLTANEINEFADNAISAVLSQIEGATLR